MVFTLPFVGGLLGLGSFHTTQVTIECLSSEPGFQIFLIFSEASCLNEVSVTGDVQSTSQLRGIGTLFLKTLRSCNGCRVIFEVKSGNGQVRQGGIEIILGLGELGEKLFVFLGSLAGFPNHEQVAAAVEHDSFEIFTLGISLHIFGEGFNSFVETLRDVERHRVEEVGQFALLHTGLIAPANRLGNVNDHVILLCCEKRLQHEAGNVVAELVILRHFGHELLTEVLRSRIVGKHGRETGRFVKDLGTSLLRRAGKLLYEEPVDSASRTEVLKGGVTICNNTQ